MFGNVVIPMHVTFVQTWLAAVQPPQRTVPWQQMDTGYEPGAAPLAPSMLLATLVFSSRSISEARSDFFATGAPISRSDLDRSVVAL